MRGFALSVMLLAMCALTVSYTPYLLANTEVCIYKNRQCVTVTAGTLSDAQVILDNEQGKPFTRLTGAYEALNLRFYGGEADIASLLQYLRPLYITRSDNAEYSCIYAYSPRLSHCILVDGTRINVQIVLRDNVVLVGFPLLIGSY